MCFARRNEFLLDSEMNLERATLEPASAALRQMGWLGLLSNSQQAGIKGARVIFPSRRHRQLHVIEGDNFHCAFSARRNDRQDQMTRMRRIMVDGVARDHRVGVIVKRLAGIGIGIEAREIAARNVEPRHAHTGMSSSERFFSLL